MNVRILRRFFLSWLNALGQRGHRRPLSTAGRLTPNPKLQLEATMGPVARQQCTQRSIQQPIPELKKSAGDAPLFWETERHRLKPPHLARVFSCVAFIDRTSFAYSPVNNWFGVVDLLSFVVSRTFLYWCRQPVGTPAVYKTTLLRNINVYINQEPGVDILFLRPWWVPFSLGLLLSTGEIVPTV